MLSDRRERERGIGLTLQECIKHYMVKGTGQIKETLICLGTYSSLHKHLIDTKISSGAGSKLS
jgi:hypothetical protein